jgi:response regulator RpfG family c-di-GMP phosphodiesterase
MKPRVLFVDDEPGILSALRLALSGHADLALTARSTVPTHQYLAKPCGPETLRAAAARAIAKTDGCSSAVAHDALLAGVMHDIGKLVLASCLPAGYEEVVAEATRVAQV